MPVLSRRALNRATVARQFLLDRTDQPALDVVRRLVGLQGQVPAAPYLGLWSRVAGFGRDDLTGLLLRRQVVRATTVRGTLHVTAAADYRWLRPLLQPLMARLQRQFAGRATAGVDPADLVAHAAELLAREPLSRTRLRELLARRWPDHDRSALLHSVQYLLPLVHLPPAGTWGGRVDGPCALAQEWLAAPPVPADPAVLVRRYLAAFGPASVADVQAWSGLTRLAEVVEPIRGELRVFRDEQGRELFDLPDAERPDPDTPAPPRLLPEYDNLLLAYADRTRVLGDVERRRVLTPAVAATVLVDGFVAGTWAVDREDGTATLRVRPFRSLGGADREALAAEAGRLLNFVCPDQPERTVRFD
ncbi:winged helix DNA-binding domain-containing protein [Micromonospora sp. PPF5-17]|uniref:Winged helix DNA-binding domain-containing protein n=1 Tax=Micromonospora solifontis TaxID=2487138 RepID=A0ABX9WKL8_9ACTN|nr:winged helix DNA-binding domain-containing protein [Micromonospora sp. PPF5-17B]NES36308.1 winged helix DNA-binding domain-containing protein [Micromonospora solifontis]NES55052.1 winged helix DNA-binding domain-containing protein [Micromonospora sp. PPF5-6]RNL99741.1 winged helix DNA-binding domain-containing protein [Micromonospora solifontis]